MTPDGIGPQGAPHVAWVFPGFGIGGAQMRFAALANHFGDRCVHTVIALNGDLACRERLRPNLHASFPAARHRPGRMVAAALHAAGFLRALRPNLVVTSNWGAIEWAIGARLAGLRHLHTEDGFGPEERLRQLPRRVLTRRLALRGSKIALPSRTLLRIATDIWRLPPARLSYIPNGIDLARFTGAAPASLPAGQGKVVGTIAALRPEKNIGRLLRAFALLRRSEAARLVIVGDGPERPALAQLARELGIAADTLFAGHTTSPQSWLAAFDIFALSSDTEQMPLSLLEAMASGLPCVCTDVGDVRAMLAPANLDFVAACSDEALAAALRRMLTADGKAIGAANRAKAWAEYGEDTMFGAYAALLEV
jgi:glycosyltransferase involved in cell wall biosynthesis